MATTALGSAKAALVFDAAGVCGGLRKIVAPGQNVLDRILDHEERKIDTLYPKRIAPNEIKRPHSRRSEQMMRRRSHYV